MAAAASASDESGVSAGEAKPEGGADLVGCYIEVYWPKDKAWYRAQVLRYIKDKDKHEKLSKYRVEWEYLKSDCTDGVWTARVD